jgi:hypothetical protein
VAFVPETYGRTYSQGRGLAELGMADQSCPVVDTAYILACEAKRLRKQTGDRRYHAQLEIKLATQSAREVLNTTILKPFIMLFREPMLAALTAYMSFVYGKYLRLRPQRNLRI